VFQQELATMGVLKLSHTIFGRTPELSSVMFLPNLTTAVMCSSNHIIPHSFYRTAWNAGTV